MSQMTENNLTRSEAEARALQVKNIDYDMNFDLTQESEFAGVVTVNMDWTGAGSSLFLDFMGGKIQKLKVNNAEQKPDYNGLRLTIPASALKQGRNQIEVTYTHPYSNTGEGLHRFQDPEDKSVYMFTDLEPFNANKVFPGFDQPDLRATYKMTVKAPNGWEVITATRESGKIAKGNATTWEFPQTARFSTYIWSLHAGQYAKWEDKAGSIPLRLFARKSLAKYVDKKEWMDSTKQGFKFFPKYFGADYPYVKYDQIIVPEYNMGAMENVGAVTFNEKFISRGQKTEEEKRELTEVILHEMSHMWFGNLVTMKWWNDLWLNESFATYMSFLAMAEATPYKKHAWRDFNNIKSWAYWEDQQVTTHPIEAPVNDTKEAFNNFDGITYGKGASWIKQTAFYLGDKTFQKGVQLYFKKYAEKNTELKDFVQSLAQGAGKDLTPWTEQWLQTQGLNRVEAQWTCGKGGKLDVITLNQSNATEETNRLRLHKAKVALLKKSGTSYVVSKVLTAEFNGDKTTVKIPATACPQIVFPNYEDEAYVKVSLDATSLQAIKNNPLGVKDDFLRQKIWASLWQMVRDGELPIVEYANIALQGISKEKDPSILNSILGSIASSRGETGSLIGLWPKDTDMEKQHFSIWMKKIEQTIWTRLEKEKAKSENQKVLFDGFVSASETKFALDNLAGILDGKIKFSGLEVDQDRRWAIIYQLAAHNVENAQSRIQVEKTKDPSKSGVEMALASEVSIPSAQLKTAWKQRLLAKDSKDSFDAQRTVMSSMFPPHQVDLRKELTKNFFNELTSIKNEKPSPFLSNFTALAPSACEPEVRQSINRFLNSNTDIAPALVKDLKILLKEGERCSRVRALAKASMVSEKVDAKTQKQ